MQGKELILNFIRKRKPLKKASKKGSLFEPILEKLSFLSFPLQEEYKFYQENEEITCTVFLEEEEFCDYLSLTDDPLRVERDGLSFTIAYAVPFFLPRSLPPPEHFLVYVVGGDIDKAKKDLDFFSQRLSDITISFVIVIETKELEKFSFLSSLHSPTSLVFCEEEKEYYGTRELWKLAHRHPQSLIFYCLGEDIARREVEEEIFSTLSDKRWLNVLHEFPSLTKLTWKASKEGYAWYNIIWVKASYILELKEPREGKTSFYYQKWFAKRSLPFSTLQTCKDKCNIGEHYFN